MQARREAEAAAGPGATCTPSERGALAVWLRRTGSRQRVRGEIAEPYRRALEGDAAGAAKEITVGILNNLIEAVVVLTLAYFLLLDGAAQFHRVTLRIREPERERVRRVGVRIAQIVRSYVSVNLLLAALAGVFTWLYDFFESVFGP